MGTVLVGVDGSPASVAALRWAVGEARLRSATLRIVHSWLAGAASTPIVFNIGPSPEATRAFEAEAGNVIERCLNEVGADATGEPELTIERLTPQEGAASALIRHSKDAELVVVGSRGRGGFTGLLLGSVSQQVAQHAECPTVIIPPSRRGSEPS